MISKKDIMTELENVYDPELSVNIIDLGLVYDVDIDGHDVVVQMTLTSPGCPAGPLIERDVIKHINMFDEVNSVRVKFVWDPRWRPDMMSDTAKLELGYAI